MSVEDFCEGEDDLKVGGGRAAMGRPWAKAQALKAPQTNVFGVTAVTPQTVFVTSRTAFATSQIWCLTLQTASAKLKKPFAMCACVDSGNMTRPTDAKIICFLPKGPPTGR